MSALKTLIALTLVVSPASLGIAAYTGAIDLSTDAFSPEETYNGKVIEEFTKSFDETITTGQVDLRVDHGHVRVEGWDDNAYKILVLQEEAEEADSSDYETEVTFEDRSGDGSLDLEVIADRQGTHSIDQDGGGFQAGGDRVELAIVAFVPKTAAYESVRACTGQDSWLSGTFDTVEDLLGEVGQGNDHESGCVPAQDEPSTMGRISINYDSDDDKGLNVTSGATGLSGEQLWMTSNFGGFHLDSLDFETVHATSDYGKLNLTDVTAESLKAGTDYGDIVAHGLAVETLKMGSGYGDLTIAGQAEGADIVTDYGDVDMVGSFDDLEIDTDYGDIDLELDVRSSGKTDVTTDYGDVDITVPARETIGYNAEAKTDYGDIDIDLSDAEVSSQGEDDGREEHKKAKTRGYDDKDLQVTLKIVTDYGDIDLADDVAQDDQDDEEEESSGSSSSMPGDELLEATLS